MINFRYHLVSIVAVLLALAIGIVIGSGFLGGPLLEQVRKRVEHVRSINDERRAELDHLANKFQGDEVALAALEPRLTGGILEQQPVVIFDFEGTDPIALDQIAKGLKEAGARETTTVSILNKTALGDDESRRTLANLLGVPTETDPGELRERLARALGTRAADAVYEPFEVGRRVVEDKRFRSLVTRLEDEGYVSVTSDDGGGVAPTSAFVVVAGSIDPAPYPVANVGKSLAATLGARGDRIVAVEPSDSTWGFVAAIRSDGQAETRVWTIDQVDTVAGRIATALALGRSYRRPAQHFGTAAGAERVFPRLPTGG